MTRSSFIAGKNACYPKSQIARLAATALLLLHGTTTDFTNQPFKPISVGPAGSFRGRRRPKSTMSQLLFSSEYLNVCVAGLRASNPLRFNIKTIAAAEDDRLFFTQFHFSIQREENVPGFQVSVDDFVLVEVRQGLQSLPAHHADLGLRQGPLELCGQKQACDKFINYYGDG